MEVARKNITDEQICQKENEIVAKIGEIIDGYREKFSAIGYEISVDCIRQNDYDRGYTQVSEEPGEYINGYSSVAKVEIKKPQAAAPESSSSSDSDSSDGLETSDENTEEAAEENQNPTEPGEVNLPAETENSDSEQEENSEEPEVITETVEEVEADAERTKAYSEIMIARIYKVFWITKVSYTDDFTPLTSDLDEFLEKLS